MAAGEDLVSHAGLPAYHSALSPSLFRNRPTLQLPRHVIDYVIKKKKEERNGLWIIPTFKLGLFANSDFIADALRAVHHASAEMRFLCNTETFKARNCMLAIHQCTDRQMGRDSLCLLNMVSYPFG